MGVILATFQPCYNELKSWMEEEVTIVGGIAIAAIVLQVRDEREREEEEEEERERERDQCYSPILFIICVYFARDRNSSFFV